MARKGLAGFPQFPSFNLGDPGAPAVGLPPGGGPASDIPALSPFVGADPGQLAALAAHMAPGPERDAVSKAAGVTQQVANAKPPPPTFGQGARVAAGASTSDVAHNLEQFDMMIAAMGGTSDSASRARAGATPGWAIDDPMKNLPMEMGMRSAGGPARFDQLSGDTMSKLYPQQQAGDAATPGAASASGDGGVPGMSETPAWAKVGGEVPLPIDTAVKRAEGLTHLGMQDAKTLEARGLEERGAAQYEARDAQASMGADTWTLAQQKFGEAKSDQDKFIQEQQEKAAKIAEYGDGLAKRSLDVMSRKVDPTRMWSNGGAFASVGAAISDGINAGISWLYGKSPGEMGDNLGKIRGIIEHDTAQQMAEIQEGRANLNAGAQVLAQLQNVYQSQGAAKQEMLLHKWGIVEDLIKARRARGLDEKGIAAIDDMLGQITEEKGKLAVAWNKEAQAAASSWAAAQRKAYLEDREYALKSFNANTDRIKAEQAGAGQRDKAQEDMMRNRLPVPGGKPGEFYIAQDPTARQQIEDKSRALDDIENSLNQAISIRNGMSSMGAGFTVGGREKTQELARIKNNLMASFNHAKGLGALDKGSIGLLEDVIGNLDSVSPEVFSNATMLAQRNLADVRAQRERLYAGLPKANISFGPGGASEGSYTGEAQGNPMDRSGYPAGFKPITRTESNR